MDKKTKSATAAAGASSENTSVRPGRQPSRRQAKNYLLVWLDASIDEVKNKDSIKTIEKLRETINNLYVFTNADDCINFIASMSEDTTFMISSGAFGQTTVPRIHDMEQVSSIYIFCGNKSRHEQWAKEWPKIKGVFTDIKPIWEALKADVQQCDQKTIPMTFVATSGDTIKKKLNQLDPSYMYTQILKEILLTIHFEQGHIKDFISFCREIYNGNTNELRNIDKLKEEYRQHTPIWWYTSDSFLYPMLNRALRTMDVGVIIRMGFFICDLHTHIAQLHSEQFSGNHHSHLFTVYRGQGMSQTDCDHLRKTKGGVISFNNFLSTSKDRLLSLGFARSAINTPI